MRLQHILDAADEINTFISGRQPEDLGDDVMLLRALSMSVGIIGEAASRLSVEFRTEHPEIPWGAIIGMRNFIFHVYFKVDPDVLWATATTSVPELGAQVRQILTDRTSR